MVSALRGHTSAPSSPTACLRLTHLTSLPYLFKVLDSRIFNNRSLFEFPLRPGGLYDHVESLCTAVILMTVSRQSGTVRNILATDKLTLTTRGASVITCSELSLYLNQMFVICNHVVQNLRYKTVCSQKYMSYGHWKSKSRQNITELLPSGLYRYYLLSSIKYIHTFKSYIEMCKVCFHFPQSFFSFKQSRFNIFIFITN
jgi:hypothetical protein